MGKKPNISYTKECFLKEKQKYIDELRVKKESSSLKKKYD